MHETHTASGGERPKPLTIELTPEMIDYHYRLGRQLQGEAIAAFFSRMRRRLFSRSDALAAAPPAGAGAPDLAHTVVSSLTAIRTTAEMLRDHPEIDPAERKRFLGIVLDEERRLETMLPPVLIGRGGPATAA